MTKQNLLLSALFAAFVTTTVPGIAAAQSAEAPSAEQQAKIQNLAQEYRGLTVQLGKIRDATFTAHPDLVKQRDAFEKQVEKRMTANGYDTKANIQKLQDIATKLKAEDLDDAKKQALVKEFQQERQGLLSAQRKALAEPKVKKAGEKLQKETLSAMKKQDENTDKLLKRMADLRENLQKISGDS